MQRFFCASIGINHLRAFLLLCLMIVIIQVAMKALSPARQRDHCGKQDVEETARLGREVRQLQKENGHLRKRLVNLEANAEKLTRLDRIREEAKREEVMSLQGKITVQENTIATLQNQSRDLSNKNTKLQDVLQHWEVKFSDLEEKQENQEEELNRATKRLDEKQREVEEWIENHSRLNQQLNKCWNQPVRYHGECSWFTVLIGIGGSCLGFGSCSNNKCS
ncbi:homer protein homolog 3-like [Heptranchias perlo]|uniref:homer protein homolog 3-like n=1 Tax=Heptranchias perlo TaxID=212740 RepID=UPI00355960DC